MKITVHNRQTKHHPSARKLGALARFFLSRSSRLHPEFSWVDVDVVLTDDAGISPINRTFLDHGGATDVITFTLPAAPGGAAGFSGEIHINLERAFAEGSRRSGAANELALYLAHGCDHLTGASDRTIAGRRRMRQRELRWLGLARRSGLMQGLWI